MLESIEMIMMDSWVPSDLQKGEKTAKVMLRVAIDFITKDIEVTKDCARAISNLASDFYEPEILSKQILLATATYHKYSNNSNEIVDELVRQIKRNNGYAADEGVMTLLKESVSLAASEASNYGFELGIFKEKYLDRILQESIDEEIKDYAEFLVELEEGERGDSNDISFETEMLEDMILAFESIRPKIAIEILQAVLALQNKDVHNTFELIIDSSKLLTKIYKGSSMITTFEEFLEFLRINAAYSESSVGSTIYGHTFIHFPRRLNEKETEAIMELERKYELQERELLSFELYDKELNVMVDFLVYDNHIYNAEVLISFLKEVNNIIRISSISTGIAFTFRDTGSADRIKKD